MRVFFFRVVLLNIQISWDMTLFRWTCTYRRFEGS